MLQKLHSRVHQRAFERKNEKNSLLLLASTAHPLQRSTSVPAVLASLPTGRVQRRPGRAIPTRNRERGDAFEAPGAPLPHPNTRPLWCRRRLRLASPHLADARDRTQSVDCLVLPSSPRLRSSAERPSRALPHARPTRDPQPAAAAGIPPHAGEGGGAEEGAAPRPAPHLPPPPRENGNAHARRRLHWSRVTCSHAARA